MKPTPLPALPALATLAGAAWGPHCRAWLDAVSDTTAKAMTGEALARHCRGFLLERLSGAGAVASVCPQPVLAAGGLAAQIDSVVTELADAAEYGCAVLDPGVAAAGGARLLEVAARIERHPAAATGVHVAVETLAEILLALAESGRASGPTVAIVEELLADAAALVLEIEAAAAPVLSGPANVLPFVPRAAVGLRLPDDRAEIDPADGPEPAA